MLVRQTYLLTALNTESEPLEAPSETEEPQQLSPTSAPLSPDYTPATPHTDDELESLETSNTRVTSPYSTTPSLSTTAVLHGWSCVRSPTLSPGYSAKLTEKMALSPPSFRKRYKSSYETPSSSSSSSLASSPTLPSWKRYRGTSELIVDTKTESDKS
ncbi:hypothetical protein Tco_1067721 [Tanacetum coccineum]|uniref:Uncharacterized protein n=1 Tax=Tanacetum coccineum TaxID=301880 RepID=A0ABQ5HDP8_9ASTR